MSTTSQTLRQPVSLKKHFGLRHEPHRFRDLGLAQSFVKSARSSNCIVMGNHPELWVVVPADATKLVKLGYEML
jgi:hypothetical protein